MEETITGVTHSRYLGVIMQDDASFTLHHENVAMKVRQSVDGFSEPFIQETKSF